MPQKACKKDTKKREPSFSSPVDGPKALSETGPEKLLIFPDKLKALLEISKTKTPFTQADLSYPISVELSLSYHCNLNCVFCSDAQIRSAPDQLNQGILSRLFSDLKSGGTRGITIEGGGEPTISPLFPKAVELAQRDGLKLGLITNGYSLFTKTINSNLYEAFQWIRVSLDASNETQFEHLKGKSGFERTLKNMELLSKLKEPPTLGVGYVLTEENSDIVELEKLIKRLSDSPLSYISIRPVVDHPELDYRDPNHNNFQTTYESLMDKLGYLDGKDFKIDLEPLKNNAMNGNLSLPCFAHSLSTVIGAEGNVWLCGRLNTNSIIPPMGSLLTSSFSNIWESSKRLSQSKLVSLPSFTQKNCPNCRMTKYNRLLSQLGGLKTPDFI
jgi:MoaA/NifB/PqqE/SkfB family radical SAM enzyme